MPCHGFAKSLHWTEVNRSAITRQPVTVELRDSERTRIFYPFAFRVDATFALSGGLLTVDYAVTSDSSNSAPMIFAIGNHIAFKVPFLPGTDPAAMTSSPPIETVAKKLAWLREWGRDSALLRDARAAGRFRRARGPRSHRISERALRCAYGPARAVHTRESTSDFFVGGAYRPLQYLRRSEGWVFQPGAMVWATEFIKPG